MPLKKCQWYGCHNEDLTEITAAEEDFCKCLVAAQFGWRDFKRRPDSGSAKSGKMFKAKTWLCDEHMPEGLANADLLGVRVARFSGGELIFGEVSHVAGFCRESRHMDQRVNELLATSPDEWLYTVKWPNGTSNVRRADVLEKRATAEAIDRYLNHEKSELEAQRQRDVHAALQRGQRAGISSVSAPSMQTRYLASTYEGLLSSLPAPIARLLPGYQPSAELVGSFTTETPAGTIHASGTGLIFNLRAHNASTQTGASLAFRDGFSFANMEAEYLSQHPVLCKDCFGFQSYDAAEGFFKDTWGLELDERGIGAPHSFTAFEEYLLTLWRMRTHPSVEFLAHFTDVSHTTITNVQQAWIPKFGAAGRSWVWNPSVAYIESTIPESFERAGMASVGYIGDATDILTESVRKQISVRNQQRSEKMHHSVARGLSWCTPTGWIAFASNLVLGRSSEYNTAVALAPQFASVPPRIALCYDKGVASLRAHLPNLNNVIVPCFLSGGQYSAEQAVRNRAIATNRYVIEVTYKNVKAWQYLQPVVPRDDFRYLNHVWWWALGFTNLTLKPLKQPQYKHVCI